MGHSYRGQEYFKLIKNSLSTGEENQKLLLLFKNNFLQIWLDKSSFCNVLIGRSWPLFLYFFLFWHLSVNTCSMWNSADDWIRTRDLWCWKRLLCQLSHNRCLTFYQMKFREQCYEDLLHHYKLHIDVSFSKALALLGARWASHSDTSAVHLEIGRCF